MSKLSKIVFMLILTIMCGACKQYEEITAGWSNGEIVFSLPDLPKLGTLYGKKRGSHLQKSFFRTTMNRQSVSLPLPNGASNINYNEANQMLSFQPDTQSAKNMTYDENGNVLSVCPQGLFCAV